MSTRSRRFVAVGIVVAALAALAIPKIIQRGPEDGARSGGAGGGAGGSANAGGKKGASGPVTVTAYVVRAGEAADRVRVTGTIAPNEQVEVASEVAGRIVAINFKEGASVRRGTLLAKINDQDLRAELAGALAHKALNDAKELRQRTLRDKQAISQSEYDVAVADMKSADADIALLRAQIAKTEIRAPFNGTIGLRAVSNGTYVVAGTRIATLTNISQVKVNFSVPERYASIVRPGREIEFTVQGSTSRYTARVYATEPNINEETRTLDVRAVCANPGNALKPGAFADIDLVLNRRSGALLVPSQSVIPDATGTKVYVAQGGAAAQRTITLGLRTDRQVEVMKGLADGDTVIVTGLLQLRPGTRLKITTIDTP